MNYREAKEWLVKYKGEMPAWIGDRYTAVNSAKELFTSFSDYLQGESFAGREIHAIKWGNGPIKILAWSLMHGNETTALRSFGQIDFLFKQSDYHEKLKRNVTIVYIPILNPDGALDFNRRNNQDIDVNRDARSNQTNEMQFLKYVVDQYEPHYALNLHDQRSIFGIVGSSMGSCLSLCIPEISSQLDKKDELEGNRNHLRSRINSLFTNVNSEDYSNWSLFDESYYSKAVGEWMQENNICTLLVESGVLGLDYNRNNSVLNLSAFLLAYFYILSDGKMIDLPLTKWNLPMNQAFLRDVLLRNCEVNMNKRSFRTDIAIQYAEYLESGLLKYQLVIDDIGDLSHLSGREEFLDLSIFSVSSLKIGHDVPSDVISQLNLNGLQKL